MIKNDIKNFYRQLEFAPRIVNGEKLRKFKKYVVVGLGGSHLAADILKTLEPKLDVVIHSDYGLPEMPDLTERLIVLSSYSGNTEEVLDAFSLAAKRGFQVAAVSTGGKLAELAKKRGTPYVLLPETGMQPRMALGFGIRGLAKLMGKDELLRELTRVSRVLGCLKLEGRGKRIAKDLRKKVPVIYSSRRNWAVSYNWKIKLNETGKVPAFSNVVPEMNHNEMIGFDREAGTKPLSRSFRFILLKDGEDGPKIVNRMNVLEGLYRDRGFPVDVVKLLGKSRLEKVFSSLMLADWVAYYTAEYYGAEPEEVPMVEEFKRLITRRDV